MTGVVILIVVIVIILVIIGLYYLYRNMTNKTHGPKTIEFINPKKNKN